MRRTTERFYPATGGITIVGITWLSGHVFSAETVYALANIFMSTFSVLSGFICMSLSILYTFGDRPCIAGLKQAGALSGILRYHLCAIGLCVIIFILSVAVILCGTSGWPIATWPTESTYILIGVGAWALLAFTRIMHLFINVLQLDDIYNQG